MALVVICNAVSLTQNRETCFKYLTFKSFNKPRIHVSLQDVDTLALYSASTDDLDIVFFFCLPGNSLPILCNILLMIFRHRHDAQLEVE